MMPKFPERLISIVDVYFYSRRGNRRALFVMIGPAGAVLLGEDAALAVEGDDEDGPADHGTSRVGVSEEDLLAGTVHLFVAGGLTGW